MTAPSLDQVLDAVIRVDQECNIRFLSAQGQQWLDKVLQRSAPANFLDILHADDVAHFRQLLLRGDGFQCEMRLACNTGPMWVQVRSFPISAPDQRVLCLIDISAWKQGEAGGLPLAYHDTLTGLPNRTYLQKATELRIDENREPFSIAMLDLDGFKKVNDTYGHVTGDAVLVETAKRLRKLVGADDIVARLGGDAFVVLYQGKDAAAAQQALKNVHLAIARPYNLAPHTAYLGVSVGIAEYPTHGSEYSALLKNADTAMYYAKSAGKNRVSVFTPVEGNVDFSITAAMHDGIQDGEFFMEFQPQFDMQRKLVGAEALMRWTNRSLGRVNPSQFIPVAEESGLMPFLGKWALRYACHQLKIFHRQEPDFVMSVNVSPVQFKAENFDRQVLEAIEETGIDPHKLVLEITESTLMGGQELVERALSNLRRCGVRFAIDDFGTGFSSLSYLTRLPVSSVKIDQTFVRAMDHESPGSDANRKLLSAMIHLSHSIGLKVVAEGVETEDQMRFLEAAGCNFVQGFLTGKPLPAQDVLHRLPPRLQVIA